MQAELTAASRHEHLVLYDPAAIPADTPVDPDLQAQDPEVLPVPAMMDLASRGQALVLHIPEEDCEARFRLYVDEEPPEHLRHRGQRLVTDAYLRVPGGLLRADGLEFLCRVGERRVHSEPQVATVPNGVYLIEVLSLMSWKAANRNAEGRRGIRRMPRIAHLLVSAYLVLGILMFPANLFVAPLIVTRFWRTEGWRGATTAVAVIMAIDAAVLAGFWLLQAFRGRWPSLFRVEEADAGFEMANPDVVVIMRTSQDDGLHRAVAFAELQVAR